MLKELHLNNIILIESASIFFNKGLHVFSGETGAGKTAILQGLQLILGMRSDLQLIRRGTEKASATALFELNSSSLVFPILESAGIETDDSYEIVIKRELTHQGKSKIYINNQLAQLGVLKQIGPFLIEVVAQHATQKLLDPDYHRELLDAYGSHQHLNQKVIETHFHLIAVQKEYQELLYKEQNETNLKQKWTAELEEIKLAALSSENEEDLLFQEYEKLAHTKELFDALSKTYHLLQEQDESIISSLRSQTNLLHRIQVANPDFKSIQEEMLAMTENLTEISFSILNFRDSLEENPERLHEINERLKLLKSLRKRYGPTLQDVLKYKEKLSVQLAQLAEITDQKETLLKDIEKRQKDLSIFCQELTIARQTAQQNLQKNISILLNELNLPNAEFIIEFTPRKADELGQENIEFFLLANKGENRAALKDRVSGGELSRLLLALKIILSDLEETPTLIFDEIDANLGGETAPKIGKLLKKMSTKKQILLITHLPQVAAFSDHHFQIKKYEESDRTFSLIQKLNEKQKLYEIERMLGGKDLSQKTRDLASDLVQSSQIK